MTNDDVINRFISDGEQGDFTPFQYSDEQGAVFTTTFIQPGFYNINNTVVKQVSTFFVTFPIMSNVASALL